MKTKILFIVPSMRGGGSERVISILLNHINRDKFDITLILLKKEGIYLADLPSDIKIIDLDIKQARYALFAIIKQIRKIQPNIVLSTLGYLNILISIIRPFFSKKIKFIARESSIVSIQNKQEKYPKLFDFLFRNFYKNFDIIISQSNYMKNDLIVNYNIDKEKIKVINNPVDIDKIAILSNEKCEEIVDLLAVGRLDKNKNFKDIIEVLPYLKDRTLTILGDGKEKENLEQLVKQLGLKNRVFFKGFQANPYKYMKQATVLILTSKYEGFPNVLLETNACGIPVVAYNCPGGTGEIIEDGVNGTLVKCQDVELLKTIIQKAINIKWDKEKMINMTKKKYGLDNIIRQYEEILC
jgi:glycosyltransferase involved in cell wall biosynthesis